MGWIKTRVGGWVFCSVFLNFQTKSALPGESMRLQILQWDEESKELSGFLLCCLRSQCVAELKLKKPNLFEMKKICHMFSHSLWPCEK